MDLDLILFGDEVIAELNVPEPEIKTRPYVYMPLLEISPGIVLPDEKISLRNCLSEVAGQPEVFEVI